jgi:phosphohistidine phosphatase
MNSPGASNRILLLMRHAKSSWKDHSLADHDRPLNKRGWRDAPQMGVRLASAKLAPQIIVSSTAERARMTASLLSDVCVPPPMLEFSHDLYHGDEMEYERVIRPVDDAFRRVMVIGHNPGLEEFVERLVHERCPLPTSAIAILELDLASWDEFRFGTPVVSMQVWRPKDGDSVDCA